MKDLHDGQTQDGAARRKDGSPTGVNHSREAELWSPSQLKELLGRHGFSFKKQLGQNFLIDARALGRIVDAADLHDSDGVFEVGPGAGVVTRLAAKTARTVVAIEKDRSLDAVLKETTGDFPHVHVVYSDVLDLDLKTVWAEYFTGCESVCVIANLPYYVTTPILFHLFESHVKIRDIIVMVQKEVADRLTAEPGTKEYGALTVAVRLLAEVQKVGLVPPSSFLPQPGVDSMVVRMHMHEEPPVEVKDTALFSRVVRAAFGVRRKTLVNALSTLMGKDKLTCSSILRSAGIDGQRRGETLSIQEFALLANAWAKYFPS